MKLSIKVAIALFLGILVSISFVLFLSVYHARFADVVSGLNWGIVITTLVMAGLVSSLIWLMVVKMVLLPITSMTETTKMIAQGNLGQRVEIGGHDEIGELGANIQNLIKNLTSALQSMANSLRETKEKEKMLDNTVKDLEGARKITLQAMQELSLEKNKVEQAKATDDALLSSIGDGVIATSAEGKIIFINLDAKKMLGLMETELGNKFWFEVITAMDFKTKERLSSDTQVVHQVLKSGQKISNRYYFARSSGSTFPVFVTASPVKINESISGAIVIFRDITQETEVDRMKTEFISLASHQLRTPLSAIRWFAELLTDETVGKLNDEQKELLKNVYDSTLRMVGLVDSLLNISRIESGRVIIDPTPTDIVELAKSVINDVSVAFKDKNHHLVISAHEALPKINIDPKLIRQVYLNLLTNAMKYTPERGEIVIFISKKGDSIMTQISDNGLGIPQDAQSKIFQKFFRAENAIKTDTNGNGLGLYLVKTIIESSQGKIWFESHEGKGTTFWFSLPLSGSIAQKGEVTIEG